MKKPSFMLVLFIIVSICVSGYISHAEAKKAGSVSQQEYFGWAATPPMGWNSWNIFGCDINEEMIRGIADEMVESGMKEAGYEYLVVDDCWQIVRDDNGRIVADEKAFPSGIKALADYIHSKGLKFGLYTCVGPLTCQRRPGSYSYEYQDMQTYADWGVDYVKVDFCYAEEEDLVARERYKIFSDAIKATGRPIVLSICEWGENKPWEWARGIGHLWRTTDDIAAVWAFKDKEKEWDSPNEGGYGILEILDKQIGLEKYVGPGHWNDPDMLQVGNGNLTVNQNRGHFSLWCMLAAPLMAGNDLRAMSEQTREILTNKEVIAINQDPLGKQGYKIRDEGDFEVWMKPLIHGDKAICLLNRAAEAKDVEINWKSLDLDDDYKIRDLWQHKALGSTCENLEVNVSGHDVIMLRLKKIGDHSKKDEQMWESLSKKEATSQ
jgi:alpha-galactosidase